MENSDFLIGDDSDFIYEKSEYKRNTEFTRATNTKIKITSFTDFNSDGNEAFEYVRNGLA